MSRNTTPQFEGAVRRDFFDPKPSRPAKSLTDWHTVALAAIIAGAFVSTVAIMHQQPPAAQPLPPPMQQTVVPAPTPVPTPAPTSKPELAPVPTPVPLTMPEPGVEVRRAELATPVRRAELILPDVRRAELVQIPIGYTGQVTMPDGQQIVVTYRGTVPTFDQLPRQPGWNDMWKVTESGHAWVWTTPSGFSSPAWQDP
jgi:hypothetical protein